VEEFTTFATDGYFMGLFDRILGSNDSEDVDSDSQQSTEWSIEFPHTEPVPGGAGRENSGTFTAYIQGEKVGGQAVQSPNGEYTLACEEVIERPEADEEPVRRFFLIYQGELVFSATTTYPEPGAVADNGTVALKNNPSDPDSASSFHVLRSSGDELINESFDESNLGPIALTQNGEYAATTTFYPDEGGYIYDLEEGERTCRFEQEVNVESLKFIVDNGEWQLVVESVNSQKKLNLDCEQLQ
jgi:hypothetical protein